MPVIDGFELIAALRASTAHRRMPVICLSGVNDRVDITRLAELGVSEYLLKPLQPMELSERIRRVVKHEANWRADRARGEQKTEDAPTLLIIDPDPNFRAFVRPLLRSDFNVCEASTAAEGLTVFANPEIRPSIVLIAERLDAARVADLLGKIARDMDWPKPSTFLLSENEDVPIETSAHFDGVICRSFEPEAFAASARQQLLRVNSPSDDIRACSSEPAPASG
ncbi:hypothetical protein BH09GEM1_BH09GEM1_11900 [soil metagenome]